MESLQICEAPFERTLSGFLLAESRCMSDRFLRSCVLYVSPEETDTPMNRGVNLSSGLKAESGSESGCSV